MNDVQTNQKVTTPLGVRMVQGRFAIVDANEQHVTTAVLVRLPINDVTRAEMSKSYCLTPRAVESGLWVFSSEDLK